jgi:opacity protein-like surface antigen
VSFGFYGSFLLTSRAALQVSFFRHAHDLNVTEPNKFLESLGEDTLSDFVTMSNGDLEMTEVAVNGRYALTEGKEIIPYVTAGGGIYVWDVKVDGNQSGLRVSESSGTEPDGRNSDITVTNQIGDEISRRNSFVDLGLNGGLGVAFKVTGEISLGVEAVYTYVFGDFDEGFASVTGIMSYAF